MNPFSVVILSKNAENLAPCMEAVREHEPAAELIVIDDGVDWSLLPREPLSMRGEKPFVFARNANLGISLAGKRDVIILNDDALLRTPGGFTALQKVATERPDFGLVASTCNNVGNQNQFPQGGAWLREDLRMVCFVCVYIPRRTINAVGLLDERYTGYGVEDDDYCLRVRNAGLRIGIFDGCFVDHRSLKSEFRGHGAGDFGPNLELFKQKWGVDNWGNPA